MRIGTNRRAGERYRGREGGPRPPRFPFLAASGPGPSSTAYATVRSVLVAACVRRIAGWVADHDGDLAGPFFVFYGLLLSVSHLTFKILYLTVFIYFKILFL
jgi:hypothetical protein